MIGLEDISVSTSYLLFITLKIADAKEEKVTFNWCLRSLYIIGYLDNWKIVLCIFTYSRNIDEIVEKVLHIRSFLFATYYYYNKIERNYFRITIK